MGPIIITKIHGFEIPTQYIFCQVNSVPRGLTVFVSGHMGSLYSFYIDVETLKASKRWVGVFKVMHFHMPTITVASTPSEIQTQTLDFMVSGDAFMCI